MNVLPDNDFREWLLRSGIADAMSRQADELYDIPEAEPDDDGLIECPLLPLRDLVMFPHMITPLFVGRERSMAAITQANARNITLIAAAQINPDVEDPTPQDLYTIGAEIAVGRMLRMPDGSTSVLAQGRRRVQIVDFVRTEPYYLVRARPVYEPTEKPRATEALMRAVLGLFERVVHLNRAIPEEAYVFAMNVEEPGWLADLVGSAIDLPLAERQAVLEIFDPTERLQRLSILLGKELDVLELEDQIHSQVQNEVDRGQREMYLREQMKAIQTELGESDTWAMEVNDLREKVNAAQMPDEVRPKALKEVERLTQMPPMAPEVGIIRTYLDWLIELPWATETPDNLDIKHAEEVLEKQHFGLPKAKERVLEYIAVRKLAGSHAQRRAPILCFAGPPGTGKTSLGKSIAEALGRKFVRLSLGGVRDEAEIRGHRRTYIGALPGRVIQAMRRAASVNPVMMLDEIDKLGQDFRGDPAAALLEVLDPEQNHAFMDHYLDVDYNLARVIFLTTANTLNTVPPALHDRLEVIEFPGYIEEEKLTIARKFLVPRQLEENGLVNSGLSITDKALRKMIRSYTYEAGVRNLEREIARVCRKVARRKAEGKAGSLRITPEGLHKFLGPPQYTPLDVEKQDEVGLVLGLAWTEAGGDTMPIEVALMDGKGGLQITGQVGEVMQESAHAAMSYLKARAKALGVEYRRFEKTDTHIHIPEGSIPKDGPSAGISLATALISAYTGRKVKRGVGLTGEVTLRGRVLPVGGIKEKVLAAHRAGVRTIILPKKNDKDLVDVPAKAKRDLKFVFVEHMDQVLAVALLPALPQRAGRVRKGAKVRGKLPGKLPGASKHPGRPSAQRPS
jgi:ATP-dependent Lon protease